MHAALALVLLVVPAAEPDASVLVARLGAGRYAEREAAAEALEELGRDALNALRSAREDRDAEIRSRAEALLQRIEGSLLLEPTPVTLAAGNATLGERVLRISAALPFEYKLDSDPDRVVQLDEAETLPFWEALARLGLRGHWTPGNAPPPFGDGRAAMLQLFARRGDPKPTQVRGPFRVELSFWGRPNKGELPFRLDLVAEPGRLIRMNGPLRLAEATDEDGESLIGPADEPLPDPRPFRNAGMADVPTAGTSFQVAASVQAPPAGTRTLARLRGTVPVVVQARRDEPRIIAIGPNDRAAGKGFSTDQFQYTILSLRDGGAAEGVTLELLAQQHGAVVELVPFRRRRFGGMDMRTIQDERLVDQLTLADARGRPYKLVSQRTHLDLNGLRVTLQFLPNGVGGRPEQLRFYEYTRAEGEVAFDFRDVPLP